MPSPRILLRLLPVIAATCLPAARADPSDSIDCPAGTLLRAKPTADGGEQWEQWCEDLWTGARHGLYRRFEAGRFAKDYGVLEFGQYWRGHRVGRWGYRVPETVPGRFDVREHRVGGCPREDIWIRDGHWIDWWHNGRKRSEGEFSACGRSGRWRQWDESGSLQGEQTYLDGEIEGESREWWTAGKPRSRRVYEDGRPIETVEVRDSNGRLQHRFERRGAVGTGLLFSYDSQGRRSSIARYENGVLDGRQTTFHTSGRRHRSLVYRDGEPRGTVTYWHANGAVAARGEYQGTREGLYGCTFWAKPVNHGTWREWDESGRLQWEEEYDHGKLLSCVLIGREKPRTGLGCRLTPGVERRG